MTTKLIFPHCGSSEVTLAHIELCSRAICKYKRKEK